MGRPEVPLGSGVLADFARGLRKLRRAAGNPSYQEMAARSHFSVSTLSRAASGCKLPSLEVTRAYVRACAGDAEAWEARWHALIRGSLAAQPAAEVTAGTKLRQVRQLPAKVSDFVGRTENVRQVRSSVQRRPPRGAATIWVVSGPPGMGKTALALHLGHLLAPYFPDCQLFADFHGAERPGVDPGGIISQFLRSLGAAADEGPVATDELAAFYRSVLADRSCLVLLDDVAAEDQVAPLIPAGSASLVIVTSRRRLAGIPAARFISLSPLAVPEASDLLRNIVPPSVQLDDGEAAELASICGGLPLAIRITGAQLATGAAPSAAALIDLLRDGRRRLGHLTAGSMAVQASFALSYGALPSPDQLVFRRLGLYPGPTVTAHDAAQLAGIDLDQALASLANLQQASLVQCTSPGRFALHDLLRLYAAGRCHSDDPPAGRAAAIRRLLTWQLHSAAATRQLVYPSKQRRELPCEQLAVPALSFSSYDDALAWLDAEHPNLVAAISLAAQWGMHQHAWMLADALWPSFYLRGHTLDWIGSLNIALASAEHLGDPDGQARVHKALAVAYSLLQRHADAQGHQQHAIELFRRDGNLMGEAGALSNLGVTNCYLGKLDEAIETLTRSARLHEQLGNTNGVGLAYTNIAWVCDDFAGRSAEAITWCNKALAAYGGDLHGRSLVFTNLSSAHRRLGNTEESITCAQQALQAHQKIGHREGQAIAHKHLAEAFAEAGQLEQARRHWNEANDIYKGLEES